MDLGTILAITVPSILTVVGGIVSVYFKNQGKDSDSIINAIVKLVTNAIAAIADKKLTPEELAQVMTDLSNLLVELQNKTGDKLTPETIALVSNARTAIVAEQVRIQALALKPR